MASRIAGVLAVVGGVAWLIKVALIWENGGTNTTEGLVGVLFDVGALTIVLALVIWAWFVPHAGLMRYRPVAVAVVLVAFVMAVNVPIVIGWVVLGRTWVAEEVGILLTALAAVVVGLRWAVSPRSADGTTS